MSDSHPTEPSTEPVTAVLAEAECISLPVEIVDVNNNFIPEVVPDAVIHAREDADGSESIPEVSAEAVIDLEAGTGELIGERVRPKYLSATFVKARPQSKIGVGIKQHQDGSLRISFIRESSLLSSSPLKVGDQILSINTKSCIGMTKAEAIRFLSEASGCVTLVALNPGGDPNHVETMVEKPSDDHPVGLAFRRSGPGTSLVVSKVTTDGLFAHSIVNVGDRVLAINQISCHSLGPHSAIDIVRNSTKQVTLLTVTTGIVHAAAVGTEAGSDVLSATATADRLLVGVSSTTYYGLPRHFCICTWTIVFSLVILSSIIIFK
jgi:hypothetical protein